MKTTFITDTSRFSRLNALLHSPLFRKLFLWFFAVNLSVLLLSVLIASQLNQRTRQLDTLIARASDDISRAWRSEGMRGLDRLHDQWRRQRLINLYLEHDGQMLGRHPVPAQVRDHLPEFDDNTLQRTLRGGEQLLATPLALDGQTYHLIMFRTLEAQSAWSLPALLTVQIGISLLAIAMVGALVARHFSAPLAAASKAVERIGAGQLDTRISEVIAGRRDEFGELTQGINHMASRIETLVNDRDRLLHDVSHEMRSPLARLRILMELARTDSVSGLQQQLQRADSEIGRMDHLIDEVLHYARATHANGELQHGMALESVNLHALAEACIQTSAIEATARDIRIELHGESVSMDGYPLWLQRALDNLLRNAIRFSNAGNVIMVSVQQQQQQIILQVADQGPGVPEDQLNHIFQPFVRIPGKGRGKGYGLGLALVQRVADLHAARLLAHNTQPHGLTITLIFNSAGHATQH